MNFIIAGLLLVFTSCDSGKEENASSKDSIADEIVAAYCACTEKPLLEVDACIANIEKQYKEQMTPELEKEVEGKINTCQEKYNQRKSENIDYKGMVDAYCACKSIENDDNKGQCLKEWSSKYSAQLSTEKDFETFKKLSDSQCP